ncbi:hypothetical protein BS50DRAFT_416443 [Corynespora cassiicola Philippines]|uniref:Uncharacterized protein n=1 Tax=Corynespora cassiicola Philippines TaxID=1448308 RepID=A0A2T2NM49_CORCC|nr:hypothetical protein BS50DRAFT_416443 [Corynespora cassiicola Philippines]
MFVGTQASPPSTLHLARHVRRQAYKQTGPSWLTCQSAAHCPQPTPSTYSPRALRVAHHHCHRYHCSIRHLGCKYQAPTHATLPTPSHLLTRQLGCGTVLERKKTETKPFPPGERAGCKNSPPPPPPPPPPLKD